MDVWTEMMYQDSEAPHALVCNEIWGGNRKVFRTLKLPGLGAWVASVPIHEGEGGGDLHYLSTCDYDLISRVVLADVSGHGRDVNAITKKLHKLLRKSIDAWEQSEFMRGINDAFGETSRSKYATAIVLSFHRVTGRLVFSNAGHPPPLWYHAAQNEWGWLEEGVAPSPQKGAGLPIGLIAGTEYSQTVVTLAPGDLLVLYTDGVTEAENQCAEDVGREQLLEWARQATVESPQSLGQEIHGRLESFRGDVRTDDVTLMVLQREKEPILSALMKVAGKNTFGRLLRNSHKS